MTGLCRRYVKNRAALPEVLVGGFAKVFEHLKTFQYNGEQSLEVWIRKIMINECLMHLRKDRKHLFIELTDEDNGPMQQWSPNVETKEILTLVQYLPAGYRTILNLYVIDGFSHKEIAALLGITESASRSQLTHARNKLRQLLKTNGWNGMIQ